MRRADAQALTDLDRLLAEAVGAHHDTTVEQTAQEFDHPGWHAETDSLLAVGPDGTLLGQAYVVAPPLGGHVVHGAGGVRPNARGRGLGQRLVGWAVERATQLHAAAGSAEPWRLQLGVTNDEADAVRLLADAGFEPVRYWFAMSRRTADSPELRAPAGVHIRTYRPTDDRALYAAHLEVFRDHWGFQPRPYEQWKHTTRADFRPDLSFLAVDPDDQIVGYVTTRVGADPDRAELAVVGTRRSWRGHGIASALIDRALVAYARAGIGTATLDVDSTNPTGALGVYQRMGFQVESRVTTYERQVGSR